MSLLAVNVRGLISKFSELKAYLSDLESKISFIIVTETWLSIDKDCALEMEGYKSFSIYRSDQVGGGIKLYYLDNVNVTIVDQFTRIFEFCECLCIKAHIEGYGKMYIASIYRPPSKSIPVFFQFLVEIAI